MVVDYGGGNVRFKDPVMDPNGGYVALFHESNHAFHDNYLVYRQYLDFSDIAKILDTYTEAIGKIAADYFSLEYGSNEFENYGSSVDSRVWGASNVELWKSQTRLSDEIPDYPQSMQILPTNNEDEVKAKLKAQSDFTLKYLVHRIGKSFSEGKDEFKNNEAAYNLMKVFFAETIHYLVGPYQGQKGFVGSYFGEGYSGIHKHNLEIHKTQMSVFLREDLKQKFPHEIRNELGLSPLNEAEDFGMVPITIFNSKGYDWITYRLPADKPTYLVVENKEKQNGVIVYADKELKAEEVQNFVFSKSSTEFFNPLNNDFMEQTYWREHLIAESLITDKIQFGKKGNGINLGLLWVRQPNNVIGLYLDPGFLRPVESLVFKGNEHNLEHRLKGIDVGAIFKDKDQYIFRNKFLGNLNYFNENVYLINFSGKGKIRIGDRYESGPEGLFELDVDPNYAQELAEIVRGKDVNATVLFDMNYQEFEIKAVFTEKGKGWRGNVTVEKLFEIPVNKISILKEPEISENSEMPLAIDLFPQQQDIFASVFP